MYYYYYYCKNEVHQNIFEAKRLFGVDAENSTSSYLLTFFVMVDSGKQMECVDWSEGRVFEFENLARKWFTANELIFAEYCEFHACWKREMKSGYQR